MIAKHLLATAALLAASLVPTLVPTPAAAQSTASTIRIEPRPYYGATVTLEQGVRVWRPLPPVKTVIVNPDKTPLSVNITEVNERVSGAAMGAGSDAYPGASAGPSDGGYGYGYVPFGSRRHGFNQPRHHRAHGFRPRVGGRGAH